GVLPGILGALGSPLANAGISPQESAAFDALAANAAAGNPYAPAIGSTAATLLAGGGPDRGGTLGDAYADLQGRLGPWASGAMAGPAQDPGPAPGPRAGAAPAAHPLNPQLPPPP